jgi:hypothetical protein
MAGELAPLPELFGEPSGVVALESCRGTRFAAELDHLSVDPGRLLSSLVLTLPSGLALEV